MSPIHFRHNSLLLRFIRTFAKLPHQLDSCSLLTAFSSAVFTFAFALVGLLALVTLTGVGLYADAYAATHGVLAPGLSPGLVRMANVFLSFCLLAAICGLLPMWLASVARRMEKNPDQPLLPQKLSAMLDSWGRLLRAWKGRYCVPVVIDDASGSQPGP